MADATPVAVVHDLGHYMRPLRRHRALVALCLVIGIVLSVAAALALRPTYTANSRVLVAANITDQSVNPTGGRTNGSVNMDTQTQLVQSLPVATIAAHLMHSTSPPAALEARVTVVVPPNTTILRISFSAHSSHTASDGANAFATAFLQNRATAAVTYQTAQIATVNDQLAAARKALIADSALIASSPAHSGQRHQAVSKQTTDQTEINLLSTQLGTLRSSSVSPGNVVSSATTSGAAPNQLREIIVVAGIVLGMLLGISAAVGRDRLDSSVRSEDDLARSGVKLIAEIRPLKRKMGRAGRAARAADALTRLRAEQRMAAMIGATLGERGGSIYLAELSPAAFADGFAARLCAELGRFGSSTEIVSLSSPPSAVRSRAPLEPTAPQRQIATTSDAAEVSAGTAALGWPTSETGRTPSNQLAPVGEGADRPAARRAAPFDDVSSIMHQVQAALTRARYVVLTGSDSYGGSEAYVLASLSQVTVVVAEIGVTSREHLADVVEQVEVTSSTLLGALLWRRSAKSRHTTASGPHAGAGAQWPAHQPPTSSDGDPRGRAAEALPDKSAILKRTAARPDAKRGKKQPYRPVPLDPAH
jgi:succinoglycan biosynthesis transport protein ExoP